MAALTLPDFAGGLPAARVDESLRLALTAVDRARECAALWFAEVARRSLHRELGFASLELYAGERGALGPGGGDGGQAGADAGGEEGAGAGASAAVGRSDGGCGGGRRPTDHGQLPTRRSSAGALRGADRAGAQAGAGSAGGESGGGAAIGAGSADRRRRIVPAQIAQVAQFHPDRRSTLSRLRQGRGGHQPRGEASGAGADGAGCLRCRRPRSERQEPRDRRTVGARRGAGARSISVHELRGDAVPGGPSCRPASGRRFEPGRQPDHALQSLSPLLARGMGAIYGDDGR